MSENDENLFPWQRPLRDSNPISQESSTPVGRPAWEKTAKKIGRVLFEQIWPDGVVQTGNSFGSQGHPRSLRMVSFDKRQTCLHFLVPISRRFGATAKKRYFIKRKLVCYGNVFWKFENRCSDRSSTAIAEPNVENRVKIRPVEVEIKGLREIVRKKKEMIQKQNIWLPGSLLRRHRADKKLLFSFMDIWAYLRTQPGRLPE